MELSNDFRVGISVTEAWKVLTDVERIAPLLPGAQLQEVDGEEYRGVVKVKVGPITAQYKGAATFVERDEGAGRVVLKASGRDTRGQGNASALITATMRPDGEGTSVSVVTDLTVTGKVAQFGRGVLAEVSTKLLGQFVDSLEADLASVRSVTAGAADGEAERGGGALDALPASNGRAAVRGSGAGEGARGNGSALAGSTETQGGSPGPAEGGARRISSPEAEPVDLLAVAGTPALKRLVPVIGVVVLVLVVLARRRARRGARA